MVFPTPHVIAQRHRAHLLPSGAVAHLTAREKLHDKEHAAAVTHELQTSAVCLGLDEGAQTMRQVLEFNVNIRGKAVVQRDYCRQVLPNLIFNANAQVHADVVTMMRVG